MKKVLFALLSLVGSIVFAASTSTTITDSAYASITGLGNPGSAITAFLPAQCIFSTTLPSASAKGHALQQNQSLAIDSLGSGIGLWCKSSVPGNNYITSTTSSDAGIWGTGGVTTTTTPAGAGTNASSTITSGGTAQVALVSNPSRRKFEIQNIDTTAEILCFNVTGTATLTGAGSMCLSPAAAGLAGGYYSGEFTGAISVIAATTGHKFTLWWY